MTVTVVAVGIVFIAIVALGYRMIVLKQPNASMTALIAALAGALMLRIPTIGDHIIDGTLGDGCGVPKAGTR